MTDNTEREQSPQNSTESVGMLPSGNVTDSKEATFSVRVSVKIPPVPNFLKMHDGQTISIADLTDDGLRGIAKQWGEVLVGRAREIRGYEE